MNSQVYEHLTVRENLLFAARMYGMKQTGERVDRLLEETGLQTWAARLVGDVSRGVRQRLSICRAVIHKPSILLLDEPFSGLDENSCDWLSRFIQAHRPGQTVCFATHDHALAGHLAERVLLLQNGLLDKTAARPEGLETVAPTRTRAA